VAVPRWVTPGWKGDWSGDPTLILDAFEAATAALRDAGQEPRHTRIRPVWEHGRQEEESVEEARNALRFAQRPKSLDAMCWWEPSEWVGVEFLDARVVEPRVEISTHVSEQNSDVAQRLVDAAGTQLNLLPRPNPRKPLGKAKSRALTKARTHRLRIRGESSPG
jgi:hypothetical protein